MAKRKTNPLIIVENPPPFSKWLEENWQISSGEYKGDPYRWQVGKRNYKFLKPIVQDKHPFVIVRKSAQCGISEINVAQLFYIAEMKRGNLLYVFPAREQMWDFSKARINDPIENNEYLKERSGPASTLHIQYAGKEIYLRGTRVRRGMISMDVSSLFIDELDEMEKSNIATLNKRLGATTNPFKRYFSCPKTSNGIQHFLKNVSDFRVWMIKCRRCKHWNDIYSDVEAYVTHQMQRNNSWYVKCGHCGRGINRLETEKQWAQYVPMYPKKSKDCHGYAISKLFTYQASDGKDPMNINALKTIEQDTLDIREFYWQDLGIPYEIKGDRLTNDDIQNCINEYDMHTAGQGCVMGVDVGNLLFVVIAKKLGNLLRVIYFDKIRNFEDIPPLITRFDVRKFIVDALPETRKAQELCEEFKGRGWICWFRDQKEYLKKSKVLERSVSVSHPISCDYVISDILAKQMSFPALSRIKNGGEFSKHLKNVQKIQDRDKIGNITTRYEGAGGANHYFFALNFARIAAALEGSEIRVSKQKTSIA